MRYYSAIDPDGNIGVIRYIIWSEVLLCPGLVIDAIYTAIDSGEILVGYENVLKKAPLLADGNGLSNSFFISLTLLAPLFELYGRSWDIEEVKNDENEL
mgnify:CR=1 FL=1